MDLDALSQLITPNQYRGAPVQLLTLSACETAAGDDRAALGMAGVAVKAGVRSAMATLWLVNDKVSSDLVRNFYAELAKEAPKISKAQALQKAQLKLIDPPLGREHPFYWAPYMIIGNWQ